MAKTGKKQQEVYDYIVSFSKKHGYSPSVREIGAAVGLSSSSSVHAHITALAEKGLINKERNKTRTLTPSADAGIPIVGRVTAGTPMLAYEDVRGTLAYIPGDDGDYFALEVLGDSMEGAGILDGDYVVVRRQVTAYPGDIVVAILDEEATVKRYFVDTKQHVWLMPENEAYEPIDGEGCYIAGKVTTVIRQLA